jgi:hypothetical protein|tara:strand:+ start:22 stop:444 length:423 start_codon:yes stop_codon:yes gene_type:complete
MRILIICIFLFSCSPQNRLNRKVKRAENFAYKHGLVIKDTIKVIDTVIVDNYIHDTTATFYRHDSTIVVNNEKVFLKYFYDTLRQEIYHEVECKGDTIIREILVPVDKIKVIEKDNRFNIIIIALLAALFFVVLRRNYVA